jgi:hypothetical protein
MKAIRELAEQMARRIAVSADDALPASFDAVEEIYVRILGDVYRTIEYAMDLAKEEQ